MKQMNLGPRNVNIEASSLPYAHFVNTAQVSWWKYIISMDWYVQNTTHHSTAVNHNLYN